MKCDNWALTVVNIVSKGRPQVQNASLKTFKAVKTFSVQQPFAGKGNNLFQCMQVLAERQQMSWQNKGSSLLFHCQDPLVKTV